MSALASRRVRLRLERLPRGQAEACANLLHQRMITRAFHLRAAQRGEVASLVPARECRHPGDDAEDYGVPGSKSLSGSESNPFCCSRAPHGPFRPVLLHQMSGPLVREPRRQHVRALRPVDRVRSVSTGSVSNRVSDEIEKICRCIGRAGGNASFDEAGEGPFQLQPFVTLSIDGVPMVKGVSVRLLLRCTPSASTSYMTARVTPELRMTQA